jgi:hypothetical protein
LGTGFNTVATLGLNDASGQYAKPHNTDDLDTGVCIYLALMRLRALWALRPVVVRVHSSAWKALHKRAFRVEGRFVEARNEQFSARRGAG